MKTGPTHYHHTVHLDEADLLVASAECPWCGSVQRRSIATLQSSPDVFLLKCDACKASSASRMPTPARLDAFYGNYYAPRPEGEVQAEGRITIGDVDRMGIHLAKSFGSTGVRQSLSILDFGGGDGLLAVRAADALLGSNPVLQEVAVTVVDHNTVMHQPAKPQITVNCATKLEDLDDGSYDFVIASAILEHIPDCSGILENLLARLKTGGAFYMRTPYVAPFLQLSQSLGKTWDFTFPAHVHDLGQAFWENYFARQVTKQLFTVVSSRPSIVQASFRERPIEALVSHGFKVPWYFFGRAWGFVGGWEMTVSRR